MFPPYHHQCTQEIQPTGTPMVQQRPHPHLRTQWHVDGPSRLKNKKNNKTEGRRNCRTANKKQLEDDWFLVYFFWVVCLVGFLVDGFCIDCVVVFVFDGFSSDSLDFRSFFVSFSWFQMRIGAQMHCWILFHWHLESSCRYNSLNELNPQVWVRVERFFKWRVCHVAFETIWVTNVWWSNVWLLPWYRIPKSMCLNITKPRVNHSIYQISLNTGEPLLNPSLLQKQVECTHIREKNHVQWRCELRCRKRVSSSHNRRKLRNRRGLWRVDKNLWWIRQLA